MYADYIHEKTGDEILESNNGFVVYRFLNDKQVYITDIFVTKNRRRTLAASALADEVVTIARARGCTELLGSVVPSLKDSTTSIKVLLGYGMRLDSSTNDLILFKKEI